MQKELEDQINAEDSLFNVGDPCPQCSSPLVLRKSSHGEFLGCSDYPSCKFAQYAGVNHSVISLLRLNKPCPECGADLEVKKGRFGIYIGCSDYENCDYIYTEKTVSSIKCPLCSKGKLTERNSKNGRKFFGCSNYPTCTFAIWGEPVESACPHCSFPVRYKKKNKDGKIILKCANPLCVNRRKRNYEFFLEDKVS